MKKNVFYLLVLISFKIFPQGYHLLKDLDPVNFSGGNGVAGTNRICLTEFKSKLYFLGYQYINNSAPTYNNVLYVSDGTAVGTKPLIDSVPVTNQPLRAQGDVFLKTPTDLFFKGYDGFLWATDGTKAGTRLVKNIGGAITYLLKAVDNKIYFVGNDGTSTQLWVSDGTANGTIKLTNITSGQFFPTTRTSAIASAINGKLYYNMTTTSGITHWVSDGTVAGTFALTTNNKGLDITNTFVEHNGFAYFFSKVNASTYKLCKTNGTSTGLQVVNTYSIPNSFINNGRTPITIFKHNNKLCYIKNLPNSSSDGLFYFNEPAFTEQLIDTIYNGYIESANSFINFNSNLYFFGTNQSVHRELFKLENNEISVVKDINIGTASGITNGFYDGLEGEIFVYNNKMYFAATDGVNPYEQLWSSDGTSAGTLPVTTSTLGQIQSAKNMISTSLGFFFVYRNTTVATELFMLDEAAISVKENIKQTINFSIYPNPAKEILNVKLETVNAESTHIKICNLLGEIVLKEIVTSNHFTLDIGHLTRGVYFVAVESESAKSIQKIIIN